MIQPPSVHARAREAIQVLQSVNMAMASSTATLAKRWRGGGWRWSQKLLSGMGLAVRCQLWTVRECLSSFPHFSTQVVGKSNCFSSSPLNFSLGMQSSVGEKP